MYARAQKDPTRCADPQRFDVVSCVGWRIGTGAIKPVLSLNDDRTSERTEYPDGPSRATLSRSGETLNKI